MWSMIADWLRMCDIFLQHGSVQRARPYVRSFRTTSPTRLFLPIINGVEKVRKVAHALISVLHCGSWK